MPPNAAVPSGFRWLPDGEHAFAVRALWADSAERAIDTLYLQVHDDTAGVAFLRSRRAFWRVSLVEDSQRLRWRCIDTQGGVEVIAEAP